MKKALFFFQRLLKIEILIFRILLVIFLVVFITIYLFTCSHVFPPPWIKGRLCGLKKLSGRAYMGGFSRAERPPRTPCGSSPVFIKVWASFIKVFKRFSSIGNSVVIGRNTYGRHCSVGKVTLVPFLKKRSTCVTPPIKILCTKSTNVT